MKAKKAKLSGAQTRRAFLGTAASSSLLGALAAMPAGAASEGSSAKSLPPNFANPEDSPISALLKDIPLPRMVPIETTFERPVIADVPREFVSKLRDSGVLKGIRPGMSIAVGAGSRGITNLPLVTRLLFV